MDLAPPARQGIQGIIHRCFHRQQDRALIPTIAMVMAKAMAKREGEGEGEQKEKDSHRSVNKSPDLLFPSFLFSSLLFINKA